MNILIAVFNDFATFSKYATGVETNMDLNDLLSSGLTAKKRVETVITPSVFTALLQEEEDSPLSDALRSAMANMTMATQLVFDSIHRRKNDVNIYKYEIEAMKRSYMEGYANAMDSIIQILMNTEVADTDTTSAAALWRKSSYYTILSGCQIRSTDDFDTIYPIDHSYLFFSRTLPLQKESLDERLGVYYSKITDENRSRIEPLLNLALAKKTIAKSLRRFDLLEFPPTIRNFFDESHISRSGKDERDGALALADRLDGEADTLIANIDTLLSTSGNADVSSYSAYNLPDDNIVMLP